MQRRFERTAARWRELVAQACLEPSGGPVRQRADRLRRLRLRADGGGSPHWSGFAPASLVVPEIALVRRGEEVWCTVAALARRAMRSAGAVGAGSSARLRALSRAAAAAARPSPDGSATRSRPHGARALRGGGRARGRADRGRGELEKIVLAREVEVHGARAPRPAAVYGVLREAFGGCFVYAVGRGEATLIGGHARAPDAPRGPAGQHASRWPARPGGAPTPRSTTISASGCCARTRSASEHAIVAERIERELRRHAVWVADSRGALRW